MARRQQTAELFKALSCDTRLRILDMLRGGALCVGALSARLDVTQGAVSQHLRILRSAGLVAAEKRGCYVHYVLNQDTLADLEQAVSALARTPKPKGARPCVRRKPVVRSRKN